jgi:alanine racemase
VEELEARGVNIPIKHVSNSASILDLPEYDLDMIRSGIILYGFLPRRGNFIRNIVLKPSLTLKSRLSNVKKVASGTGIGYGLTFWTRQPSIIGTIPIGYADGLMRGLSNHGWVSVRGIKANIIGRISMDQCMVDLTNNFGAEIGDEVVVFGGNGAQTTEDIANIMGTIGDEILCAISRRIPRVYFKNGRIMEVRDYLIS